MMGITLQQAEKTAEDEKPKEKLKFKEIPRGPEFLRIRAIARRPPPDPHSPEAVELAEMLTDRMAKKPDPYPGRLTPLQALAIKEAWEHKRFTGLLRAGSGKTLTFYLMMKQLGAKRPLFITKAALMEPALKEFRLFAKDWHGLKPHEILTLNYETLANPEHGQKLGLKGEVLMKSTISRMRPDMVFMDECHAAGNSSSATAQRLEDYFDEARQDGTLLGVFVASGTFFRTTIKDGEHLLRWTLQEDCPLPTDFVERELWSSYLDVRRGALKANVGALVDFLEGDERRAFHKAKFDDERRTIMRRAVSRFILNTPGVINTREAPIDVPITVTAQTPEPIDKTLEEHFKVLRKFGRLPDGRELTDHLQVAHAADVMGYGGYQIWDPAPPESWRIARGVWTKWCRKMLRVNRRKIDSEAKMKEAIRQGLYDDEGALENWESEVYDERERTGHNEPPTKFIWLSDELIRSVESWVRAHPRGIVFCGYIGVGERLSKDLGLPFYHEGGFCKKGVFIEDHHGGGPVIASHGSNGTGRNLQFKWNECLWLCRPNEQSLARIHRPGQKLACNNFIYVGCAEHLKGYYYATDEKSAFAEDMDACVQRLRYAETNVLSMADLERFGGKRWVLPKKNDPLED